MISQIWVCNFLFINKVMNDIRMDIIMQDSDVKNWIDEKQFF